MSNSLSLQTLRELHAGLSGIAWVHGLARAGVRRKESGLQEALYALAHRLDEIEQQIEATMAADRLYFQLPTAWWAWVPLLFSFGFLYAAQGEHLKGRLVIWALALMLFFAFAALFWFRNRFWEAIRLEKKRRNRPQLKSEKDSIVMELLQTRDALLAQVADDAKSANP